MNIFLLLLHYAIIVAADAYSITLSSYVFVMYVVTNVSSSYIRETKLEKCTFI